MNNGVFEKPNDYWHAIASGQFSLNDAIYGILGTWTGVLGQRPLLTGTPQ